MKFSSESSLFDLAIIGAGAAGLTTAIAAAQAARAQKKTFRIVLLDSKPKVGAKILMSGGTRCNVTNESVQPKDFEGGPQHFIKHVLEAFTPEQTIAWFRELGVELILESTGKYFPTTNSAGTVLEALLKEVAQLEIELLTGKKISVLEKSGELFELKSDDPNFLIRSRAVVLTTGGLSHPGTGSDGTGYALAKHFGHHIIPTFPGLTPLLTDDADWKSLSGISLEVELSFYRNGKKEASARGALLFTHFGFSGPAALDISRHFAGARKEDQPEIKVNFLPATNENSFKIKTDKPIKNFLTQEFSLPSRFVDVFLNKVGLEGGRKTLTRSLFYYPLEVTGVYGYQKAEVTAGGVDLKEVKVQTMESKKVAGLYFAGEILDIDGRIGGFNFQWAWSTGTIAGRGIVRSLAK